MRKTSSCKGFVEFKNFFKHSVGDSVSVNGVCLTIFQTTWLF